MPRVLAGSIIDLIGLRIKLTRHQRCKKHCPNANQYYILSQVDIKLIDKDLQEQVTSIQQGIINIKNLPYQLATRLTKRAVIRGKSSRGVRQSALGESSTVNSLGVINYFHISSTGLILDQQITPILVSRLPLLSLPILLIYRLQGINRVKDLKEFFKYQRQSIASNLNWEADFKAAHKVVYNLRQDLELLRDKSNSADPIKELVKAGIKLGIARRLQKDLKKWVNKRRTQLKGTF